MSGKRSVDASGSAGGLDGGGGKAETMGQPQCIVIVDASGEVLAEIRMTGAKFLSRKSALAKALTAASIGNESLSVSGRRAHCHRTCDRRQGHRAAGRPADSARRRAPGGDWRRLRIGRAGYRGCKGRDWPPSELSAGPEEVRREAPMVFHASTRQANAICALTAWLLSLASSNAVTASSRGSVCVMKGFTSISPFCIRLTAVKNSS